MTFTLRNGSRPFERYLAARKADRNLSEATTLNELSSTVGSTYKSKENSIMPIPFNAAIAEDQKFVLSPGCKTENVGYFTNLRVDRKTVPNGWYAYDIRHGDSGSFCTIEPYVIVNHAGTFLTRTKVHMTSTGITNKPCRHLSGRGGYTFEN